MGAYRTNKKANILRQLCKKTAEQTTKTKQACLEEFVRDFYLNVPADDLIQRSIEELVGQTLLAWQFIQTFDAKSPKISILNPDPEANNWHSSHTVVMVIQSDMPFLADSVRMELSRHEIRVHAVQSILQQVTRDAKGRLKQRALCTFEEGRTIGPGKLSNEALLYFEIDRQSSKKHTVKALVEHLQDVMQDVQVVVEDFEAMKSKVGEIIRELEYAPAPVSTVERQEARVFLEWLLNQNFTFLGYKAYDLTQKKGKPFIDAIEEDALGIVRRKERSMRDKFLDELNEDAQEFVLSPKLISFAKSGTLSRVHRPAYPDYVAIRRFNEKGEVIGEHGFLGLYTLPVYTERTVDIPILRTKVQEVMRRSGLPPLSHEGKELARVLETYPRDELFQTDTDELSETATRIAQIKERVQTKLFVRKDHYGKFISCFVYLPRESYDTELRQRIQDILSRAFHALHVDFTTYFGESVLVRTQFTLRTNPNEKASYDLRELEREIQQVTQSWQEELSVGLVEQHGEELGLQLSRRFQNAFQASYRDDFNPSIGVQDIGHLLSLDFSRPLSMWLYQKADEDPNVAHFSIYHEHTPIPLSDIIPILENMGLHVIGEHPYRITDNEENIYLKHDFYLIYKKSNTIKAVELNQEFCAAIEQLWHGRISNDIFNRLVLGADLGWRDVVLLRAFARYLKQIRLGVSHEFFADTLLGNTAFAVLIVDYFATKFDPDLALTPKQRDGQLSRLEKKYLSLLEGVESFTEDLVLRRYLDLCKAMLRTNFFQQDEKWGPKSYISFKFQPQLIPDVPQPVPMYEIFVYSNRVEGVHLRGGKVARGGLRWSDRFEDYRTEILGLVKAQQVKNAVIVPVGAKGGFIAKRAGSIVDRADFLQEGVDCYRIFISGLLDLSDNLVDDKVIPPARVLRYDADDPYMVVAADKGTATFSDISNGLAKDYGFWLGDAFASGGSQGYDHKKMGITARGAWVSVQRHFREKGIDVQTTDFTVVGIGDMGGDVFGNGMLLSEHIQLVAVFNHLHIFIDPNPDPGKSFSERQRLFSAQQSGWSKYNSNLISKGGGVFLRTAKSIPISPEMKQRFGIKVNKLTPNALLQAILHAPVDLLWNGGIGTYVKSTNESHDEVGDRANDPIRVNGSEVGAQVIGEGGNLGATQLGRIEYCLQGGACNTDFIDNAGGVDCSDHEVNIKILLNSLVSAEQLAEKQRNRILATMTDEVAKLVLDNNYRQVESISISHMLASGNMHVYRRFINAMEKQDKLNRALEFLPTDAEIAFRSEQGQTLTRPELSVLTSYAKGDLKEQLVNTCVTEDDYLIQIIETAFPQYLRKRYKEAIYSHKLRREIIATQLANEVVNTLGITFVPRMQEFTGASLEEVVTAYVIARDIFKLPQSWQQVKQLDSKVDAQLQLSMLSEMVRLIRHAVRWLLRQRSDAYDIRATIERYRQGVVNLEKQLPGSLTDKMCSRWQQRHRELTKAGVPGPLATRMASIRVIYFTFDVVEIAQSTGTKLDQVFKAFLLIASNLKLEDFRERINQIDAFSQWHHMARESFRDDLDAQLRALTQSLFRPRGKRINGVDALVNDWLALHEPALQRWRLLQEEFQQGQDTDFALYSVALRELTQLAQISSSG